MSLNDELANLFANFAAIMEIKGENQFKAIAFSKVGRILKDMTFDIRQDRSAVELGVRDTGAGIPLHQREKIFQLYFTTKPHGSGIGLARVYRAVQLHGGNIELESEPGKGTRFLLKFPALIA